MIETIHHRVTQRYLLAPLPRVILRNEVTNGYENIKMDVHRLFAMLGMTNQKS